MIKKKIEFSFFVVVLFGLVFRFRSGEDKFQSEGPKRHGDFWLRTGRVAA